jgi:hypothetical protein
VRTLAGALPAVRDSVALSMNDVHEMGGMYNFGKVEVEPDDPSSVTITGSALKEVQRDE